ncbi:uncharacterized protein LOC116287819 [Actinia tenebrosa]|uniref:Uncharacterized protein LOC116287819 n=1 Tax=Actinia tenebrosa TaxID=6105 RepID=A0A6P8H4M2_ACTTE|nr:uncharacterized protein LOC116287819 [Actinia tenebrosa]
MNFQERCTLAALLLVLPGFCVLEDIRHLIWEQCTDDLFEPEVNGMVLINHSFRLLKAEMPILCLFVCKSNKDCVSFNIAPSNETEGWFSCELNQADRYIASQDFRERKGFSYRGIKNPCLNNGLCEGNKTCTRLGYDLTKYTCLCPNGYFGQNSMGLSQLTNSLAEVNLICGITVESPELIYPIFDPPLPLKKDDKLRVWFSRDLLGLMASGTYGKTCTDVYVKF